EVLAALQKVIPKNLSKDRKKKAEDKDVYRGINLQMAYYFKPTEARHSILLKDKNVTYQGFSIFRKTLVIIVEPLGGIIEFGGGVKVASSMSIDDYMGQEYSSDVDEPSDQQTNQIITID
ncbi:10521_t:CDS:2, partial [Acaulospora morrowiae]